MANIDDAIMELDDRLAELPANAGILMSFTLYNELYERGLITHERFGILGTELGLTIVPAYRKTHLALATLELDALEFQVGDA